VPRGLDWEGAAKRDYVRDHGSTPYWSDLPKPKSLQRRPEETKTGKAFAKKARERCLPIVSEFRALPAEERVRAIERYRARIRSACTDERRSVPASRRRYAAAIDSVQAQLLGDMKRLAHQSTKPHKSGSAKPREQLGGLNDPLNQASTDNPQETQAASKTEVSGQKA